LTVSLFAAVSLAGCAPARAPGRQVLLVGVDGVSAEGFQYATTPNITALLRTGVISLKTRAVMPTVSAPNWASILSGAGPEQHGVTSNEWSPVNHTIEPTAADSAGRFPSIFDAVREKYPTAAMGMFYDWDWLGTYVNPKLIDECLFLPDTRAVTEKAVAFLKARRPVFTFVYYGHPDEVGHDQGHGTPAYFQSIADIDAEIGKLVAALREAGMLETTTIVIVSDHGGIAKGHGGESPTEMEVPWIASGHDVAKDAVLTRPNDAMNTAPTIARMLNIDPPACWTGRVVTEVLAGGNRGGLAAESGYVSKPFSTLRSGLSLTPGDVTLTTTTSGAEIRYTLDGSVPGRSSTLFAGPFTVTDTSVVRTRAFLPSAASQETTVRFGRIHGIEEVRLEAPPSPKYATDQLVLLDGARGSSNYKDGRWTGFEGQDLDMTLDWRTPRTVRSVSVSCLHRPESWIFLPTLIEYFVSNDGARFVPVGRIRREDIVTPAKAETRDLAKDLTPIAGRYLRVVIRNIGTCPAGHPGAGQKAWLFVDEVTIR
jgi:hypothetical protein